MIACIHRNLMTDIIVVTPMVASFQTDTSAYNVDFNFKSIHASYATE